MSVTTTPNLRSFVGFQVKYNDENYLVDFAEHTEEHGLRLYIHSVITGKTLFARYQDVQMVNPTQVPFNPN